MIKCFDCISGSAVDKDALHPTARWHPRIHTGSFISHVRLKVKDTGTPIRGVYSDGRNPYMW